MSEDSYQPRPLATWNRARGVWETTALALCGHSEPYWATWPTSGSTRAGSAYALPMSAPPMDGSECSSLLGTPRSNEWKGADTRGAMAAKSYLSGQVTLLPTPEAKLSDSGPDYARAGRDGSGGDDLTTSLHRLLPTPRATDGTKGGPNQRGSSGDLMLPSAVLLPTPTTEPTTGNGHARNLGAEALLPTPRSQNGEDRNNLIWERPEDQPQNLENALARLPGASTNPRFVDGNTSSDDPPHLPLSPDEPERPG